MLVKHFSLLSTSYLFYFTWHECNKRRFANDIVLVSTLKLLIRKAIQLCLYISLLMLSMFLAYLLAILDLWVLFTHDHFFSITIISFGLILGGPLVQPGCLLKAWSWFFSYYSKQWTLFDISLFWRVVLIVLFLVLSLWIFY